MNSPARTPSIEDYATVEAWAEGVPVYAFGYTYVHGCGPDLLPGVVMQRGNDRPLRKFIPKKSWEIRSNCCGSTPAREPKTAWNDDQPLLPVHLVDGDPDTAWCSRGMILPDTQPQWIRIDLPAECTVRAVALACCREGVYPVPGVGRSLPRRLTVKTSRDGAQWDTVFDDTEFVGDASGRTEIALTPSRAKMIWIVGRDFPRVGDWGAAFSIATLEVLDDKGRNCALISRGAGVQVSSTYFGFGMDRFTQDMLWPIQYDLGFTWTRVGYDIGAYLWSYVEREKGVLAVDAKADDAISDAARNGVNVILCLDKGNWLYRNPPRKVDWRRARTREMMETYQDHPGWPHESAALMEGYLRYVDYMVRHFRERVAYYEVCNEWVGRVGVEDYAEILMAAIPVIKAADPGAKVMLGSVEAVDEGIDRDAITACLRRIGRDHVRRIDAIGFHPWYHPDVGSAAFRAYRGSFLKLEEECRALGFDGRFVASEWAFLASYPQPGGETIEQKLLHEHWGTEMQKAKYCARLMTAHAGMGIISLFNETFQTGRSERDVTLLRNSSFQVDPITPAQPQPAYYVLRSISTVTDGYEPAGFEVTVIGRDDLEWYTFRRNDGRLLLAIWIPGPTDDGVVEDETTIRLHNPDLGRACVYDVLNGTRQELSVIHRAGALSLEGILVKDYPVFIELAVD